MKKYKLLATDTIQSRTGETLYRIQALKDFGTPFGTVRKGDLGGYIAKESNLSHEGQCWVYGECPSVRECPTNTGTLN